MLSVQHFVSKVARHDGLTITPVRALSSLGWECNGGRSKKKESIGISRHARRSISDTIVNLKGTVPERIRKFIITRKHPLH